MPKARLSDLRRHGPGPNGKRASIAPGGLTYDEICASSPIKEARPDVQCVVHPLPMTQTATSAIAT